MLFETISMLRKNRARKRERNANTERFSSDVHRQVLKSVKSSRISICIGALSGGGVRCIECGEIVETAAQHTRLAKADIAVRERGSLALYIKKYMRFIRIITIKCNEDYCSQNFDMPLNLPMLCFRNWKQHDFEVILTRKIHYDKKM